MAESDPPGRLGRVQVLPTQPGRRLRARWKRPVGGPAPDLLGQSLRFQKTLGLGKAPSHVWGRERVPGLRFPMPFLTALPLSSTPSPHPPCSRGPLCWRSGPQTPRTLPFSVTPTTVFPSSRALWAQLGAVGKGGALVVRSQSPNRAGHTEQLFKGRVPGPRPGSHSGGAGSLHVCWRAQAGPPQTARPEPSEAFHRPCDLGKAV